MWILKIFAKIILSRLKIPYRYWAKINLFSHGQMDLSEYSLSVVSSHLDWLGFGKDLEGRTLLELGPGDSVASALIIYSLGGRAILVDVGAFASGNLNDYVELTTKLNEAGGRFIDIESCNTVDDLLRECNGIYLQGGLASLRSVGCSSVDGVFSQAVLEHIRAPHFDDHVSEMQRVLKAGGRISHVVDLKDHLGGKKNNLRFPSFLWESDFFTASGFYTNRLSETDIIDSFHNNGFDVCSEDRLIVEGLAGQKVASEFKNMSEGDLVLAEFRLVGCRA